MKKIKINIPGFGERYCSDNVEYKLYHNGYSYKFYKKGTNIYHNEYGTSVEWKDGSYRYFINGELHSLNDYTIYNKTLKYKQYFIIGKFIGNTKEYFIKYLANILIPR